MARPVAGPVIKHKDDPDERHVYAVEVTDENSREQRMCLDVYDSHGELLRRLGYKHGPIVNFKNSVIYGDTLVKLSPSATKYVKGILEELGVGITEEDEE